jgi:hypothetical protein
MTLILLLISPQAHPKDLPRKFVQEFNQEPKKDKEMVSVKFLTPLAIPHLAVHYTVTYRPFRLRRCLRTVQKLKKDKEISLIKFPNTIITNILQKNLTFSLLIKKHRQKIVSKRKKEMKLISFLKGEKKHNFVPKGEKINEVISFLKVKIKKVPFLFPVLSSDLAENKK